MKACGGNTFKQLIVALVEPLVPTLSARLWSDFTSGTTSPSALVDLIKFIERRIQAVEHPNPLLNHRSFREVVLLSVLHTSLKLYMLMDRINNIVRAVTPLISFISVHSLRDLTVDKRHNIVRKHHLCFNCFSKGHSVECNSKCTRGECGRKCHSLLHKFTANKQASSNG